MGVGFGARAGVGTGMGVWVAATMPVRSLDGGMYLKGRKYVP